MDGGEDEEIGRTMELGTDDGLPALREDAPATRFDPTPYLRQLRGRGGGGEYLDVKWRLLWLRTEHPDAEIVTEHVQIEPTLAIFKATVTLRSGGKATGYGSETAGDFGDFIEKAETKAIGRALNALGYGAQFREPGEEELPSATASFPQRPGAATRPGGYDGDRSRGGPTALPPARPAERSSGPPIDLAATRERSAASASTRRERPTESTRVSSQPRPADEPHAAEANAAAAAGEDLSDYSWTAFREWAESTGLPDRAAMEAFIDRPLRGLSPAEARDLVLARRGEA